MNMSLTFSKITRLFKTKITCRKVRWRSSSEKYCIHSNDKQMMSKVYLSVYSSIDPLISSHPIHPSSIHSFINPSFHPSIETPIKAPTWKDFVTALLPFSPSTARLAIYYRTAKSIKVEVSVTHIKHQKNMLRCLKCSRIKDLHFPTNK